MLGRFRDPVWRAIVLAFSLVEVPLFLLRNRRAMARNRILFPFWHWSFGHTITAIDYASRLYWPHRISLLYIPHPSSNPRLPELWAHNVDVFRFESRLRFRSVNIDMPRFAVLRFFALLLAGFRMRHYVVERLQLYRTLTVASEELVAGRPDTNRAESVIDYTGYVRLIHDEVGRDPGLPEAALAEVHAALAARHPAFLERPFVALVLRTKGRGLLLESALRDAGPAENYLPAATRLVELGYHVVPWGVTDPFRGLPGVYTLDDLDAPPELVNLFVFTRCAFFVGQQSGAPVLADAANVPCLIVDTFPYSYGMFRRRDVLLHKNLRERETGRVLSPAESFRDHPDLALGYNLEAKGIEVVPNTPEELVDAVEELDALVRGTLELTPEDLALWDA